MLMRLEDARTHGIQVKLSAENIMIILLLKVAGMWIQDWSGKIVTDFGTRVFWNWRWNETWYPNLDTVIRWNLAFLESKSFLWCQDPSCSFRDLDAEGVKVTAYVTAHLNVDGDVYTEAAAVSFFGHSFL